MLDLARACSSDPIVPELLSRLVEAYLGQDVGLEQTRFGIGKRDQKGTNAQAAPFKNTLPGSPDPRGRAPVSSIELRRASRPVHPVQPAGSKRGLQRLVYPCYTHAIGETRLALQRNGFVLFEAWYLLFGSVQRKPSHFGGPQKANTTHAHTPHAHTTHPHPPTYTHTHTRA